MFEDSDDDEFAKFGRPVLDDPFAHVPVGEKLFANADKSLEQEATVQNSHEDKLKNVLSRETDAKRNELVPSGIARALAKGRVAVAMTQRQLATRLNIDRNHLAAIEAGTAVFDAQEIRRIRLFLGLPKF